MYAASLILCSTEGFGFQCDRLWSNGSHPAVEYFVFITHQIMDAFQLAQFTTPLHNVCGHFVQKEDHSQTALYSHQCFSLNNLKKGRTQVTTRHKGRQKQTTQGLCCLFLFASSAHLYSSALSNMPFGFPSSTNQSVPSFSQQFPGCFRSPLLHSCVLCFRDVWLWQF